MNPTNHVRHQTETPPFVPFVNYVAPTFYVGDAIYTGLDAAVRFMGRRFKALGVNMREAQSVDALMRLDDHALNDIGLRRSQIGRIARLVSENPGVDYRVWCH